MIDRYTEPFAAAEGDGCEPFRVLADHLGCDEYQALDAFWGVGIPEWQTPAALGNLKTSIEAHDDAARCAAAFLRALDRLSLDDYDSLIQSGIVAKEHIEATEKRLRIDAVQLRQWYQETPRPGGKNVAAYAVAEGTRRLFRRLRYPISFGKDPEFGGPSTEFGRAVQVALGAFGVTGAKGTIADWGDPTKAAFSKQRQIERRLERIQKGNRRPQRDSDKNS